MNTLPLRSPVETPSAAGAPPAGGDRLLVDTAALSRLLTLSVRTLRRMDSCRDLPGRVVVRRRVLYQLAVIREWIAAGCPDRAEWTARQTAAKGDA